MRIDYPVATDNDYAVWGAFGNHYWPALYFADDIDADGNGMVPHQRVYQLIRQPRPITDRTFEITFLDPGVQAYCFTFG